MKIPLKLNGEQKIFEAEPTEKLMDTCDYHSWTQRRQNGMDRGTDRPRTQQP